MSEYGLGTTLLASLTGRDVSDVATKPVEALRAIAAVTKVMARLAADRASEDPDVREAAVRRTEEIAAQVRAAEATRPSPTAAGERFRDSVEDILTKLLRDLETACPPPE